MRLPSIVLAVSLAPSVAIAQSVKKCDAPKVPIGLLPHGTSTVWYRVSKDGKVDTASLGVVAVQRMSVSGVRSVAVRVLSACRFDVSKGSAAPAELVTELWFDSAGVALESTRLSAAPPTLLVPEPFDLAQDSLPWALTDRRLEERPRLIRCSGGPRPPEIQSSARGATRQDARVAAQADTRMQIDNWNRMNTGQLSAEIVVDADGKVNELRVASSSNPAATAALSEMIRTCTWVPGRYHGRTVATRGHVRQVVSPIPFTMPVP